MPYQVTADRPPYRYTRIVPRRKLAATIIEQLVALNFTLTDFQTLITQNNLSSVHILSEVDYQQLIALHPEMDFIYSETRLNDQTKIHYHTNWTVSPADWQTLANELAALNITITTLKYSEANPEGFLTQRSKTIIEPNEN